MVFITKSNKIDEQRSLRYRLEGQPWAQRSAWSRWKLLSKEDQRILLVIGPCSSDNEELWWTMPVLGRLTEQVKIRFSLWCGSIRLNLGPMGMAIKAWCTNQIHAAPALWTVWKAVRHLHYRVITETGLTTATCWFNFLSLPLELVPVEDQEHRFVSSGISAPLSMKNPTSGNLSVMFNTIYAAQHLKLCSMPSSGNIRNPCPLRPSWGLGCKW